MKQQHDLIHLAGSGRDVSRFTIVAYRVEFTPAGSRREDFFFIDPDSRKVQHIEGLKGRLVEIYRNAALPRPKILFTSLNKYDKE